MDTDPNPFRDSPDSDRSASPTEAPDDDTRDFTTKEEATSTGDSSPMSGTSSGSSPDSVTDPNTSNATPGEPSSQTDTNPGTATGSTQPV